MELCHIVILYIGFKIRENIKNPNILTSHLGARAQVVTPSTDPTPSQADLTVVGVPVAERGGQNLLVIIYGGKCTIEPAPVIESSDFSIYRFLFFKQALSL